MSDARYTRQTGLTGFGPAAQAKLREASVLIVGAGGLGLPAAAYLAAMGVGRLGIVDDDRVAESNLHRQVAYTPADVGQRKADVLAQRLRTQNPDVRVDAHAVRLTLETAAAVALRDYDLVLDASDNFPTRYLVNDLCVFYGLPLVYGATQGFEGQVSVFHHGDGAPTYRCLFPESAANANIPDCAVGGVLGVLPGIVGTQQALEAVKVLTGVGQPLSGRLWLFDGLAGTHVTLTFAAVADNARVTAGQLGARHGSPEEVPAEALALRLSEAGRPPVVDVRERHEREAEPLEGSVHAPLSGFDDWVAARAGDFPRRVFFVCASGQRSRRAARAFNRATDSRRGVSVRGGVSAYRALPQSTTP